MANGLINKELIMKAWVHLRKTEMTIPNETLDFMRDVSLKKCAEMEECASSVIDVIKQIPQRGQVQYDLQRQLRELRIAANKLGLYDAADFLRSHCG